MAEDRGGKRRTRRLTDDEWALWDHAARTMTRLEGAKGRVHPALPDIDDVLPTSPTPAVKPPAPMGQRQHRAPREPARPPVVLPPYSPPVSTPKVKPTTARSPDLSLFDTKSARRLRGGRTVIEARIDLHGMRRDEAQAALVSFLRSSQARGLRYVLVITGKGAPRRSNFALGEIESWSLDRLEPPGVLRRSVPVWLATPDMRSIVVSYTEAAIQHGGAGALYVQLRARL